MRISDWSSDVCSSDLEQGRKHRTAIETAAQGVLDARAGFPDATLADLYDPLTMPPALVKPHQRLDKAVDAAYLAADKAAGRKPPTINTDPDRVRFSFASYHSITTPPPTAKTKRPKKQKQQKPSL